MQSSVETETMLLVWLLVILDRIVCTSSGTLLALWQVMEGTEPASIRQDLKKALPHSPRKQLISDQAIVHTTIARLLEFPSFGMNFALQQLNQRLCGITTSLHELW